MIRFPFFIRTRQRAESQNKRIKQSEKKRNEDEQDRNAKLNRGIDLYACRWRLNRSGKRKEKNKKKGKTRREQTSCEIWSRAFSNQGEMEKKEARARIVCESPSSIVPHSAMTLHGESPSRVLSRIFLLLFFPFLLFFSGSSRWSNWRRDVSINRLWPNAYPLYGTYVAGTL